MQAGANEFGNDVGGNEMPRSEEEVGVRFHKGDGTETEPEVSGGGGGGGDCCCCGFGGCCCGCCCCGVVVEVVVVVDVVLFVVLWVWWLLLWFCLWLLFLWWSCTLYFVCFLCFCFVGDLWLTRFCIITPVSVSFGFLQYMEGFSNRPKLNRTPNSTLVGIPGEFDGPMN